MSIFYSGVNFLREFRPGKEGLDFCKSHVDVWCPAATNGRVHTTFKISEQMRGERIQFILWFAAVMTGLSVPLTAQEVRAAKRDVTEWRVVGPFGHPEFKEAPANADIQSGNVYVCIRPTWNTSQTIQVKVKVVDKEAAPTAPATGSITDTFTRTWTISARSTPSPTALKKTSGAADSDWVANRSDFTYMGMPEQPDRSRPFYQGHTVQESFSTATPMFGLQDLTPGIISGQGLQSEEDVKSWTARAFKPGNNSTFVFDSTDQFNDAHTGILNPSNALNVFTYVALKAEKAGIEFEQTYSCGGKIIGKAKIAFMINSNQQLIIRKTHIGIL